jgi:hypothetical protein
MKKFLAAAVLIGLSVTLVPIASGDVPEENFYPTVKQESGWMGYNSDNSIGHTEPSSLYALAILSRGDSPKSMYLCDSLETKECTTPEINAYQFTSKFTKCNSASDSDCIDSFSIKNEDGSIIPATFQRNWGPDPVYKGDKAKFLPTGYGSSTWTLTNSKGITETYALALGLMASLICVAGPIKRISIHSRHQFNQLRKLPALHIIPLLQMSLNVEMVFLKDITQRLSSKAVKL